MHSATLNARYCRRPRHAGLTLIELVIVLAILIVLAGLVVPRLRNYFGQAHGAACVTNMTEISKWWELYRIEQGSFSRYPDRLDNLCQSDNTLYSLLLPDLAGRLAVYQLTAPDVAILNNVGLTRVLVPNAVQPLPPNRNATLFEGTEAALAVNTSVAVIDITTADGQATLNLMGQDPLTLANFRYYVFGIGSQCSAVGTAMTDAPMHITETGNPVDRYNRYLVVYRQELATGRLRFIGSLGGEGAGISEHYAEFYKQTD